MILSDASKIAATWNITWLLSSVMYNAANGTFPGPGNGITGGNYDVYGADRRIPRSMTAFTAIAWYNTIEILVLIFFVFKKYSELYFWSLLITTLSVIPYATGSWMKQNNVSHNERLTDGLMTVGWLILVPGQSIVLYSRLHLISQSRTLLRFLLWLIVIDTIVLCTPTSVLMLSANITHKKPYINGYAVMEKIQMTAFTAQEFLISGIYLFEVRKVLKFIIEGSTRRIMWQLVAMNILIIVLDIALLTVEFFNYYMIETTLKALVYSVKLKVEFAVLSKIISVVTNKANKVGRAPRRPAAVVTDLEKSEAFIATTDSGFSDMSSVSSPTRPRHRSHRQSEPIPQDDIRQLRGLQQNIPTDWRLSIGHEPLAAPNLLEIQRSRESSSHSLSSIENLYPGRLG